MQIEPSGPLSGVIRLPGSKSITQRALLMGALAEGESELKGALLCEDTILMIRALEALGVGVSRQGEILKVRGTGGRLGSSGREIFLGNNGTALRFLCSAVCWGKGAYRLTGSKRLCQRPMGPLLEALEQLGASVRSENSNGCAPLTVHSKGGLEGGHVMLSGSQSSQFASSLLISGALMRQGLLLELDGEGVSRPYLRMTLETMEHFGVKVIQESPVRFRIRPGQAYHAASIMIEGDLSGGSYFLTAAALCGGRILLKGAGRESLQGDMRICSILEQMGSRVRMGESWIQVEGRPMGAEDLHLDLRDAPDLVPTVAVLAAVRKGLTRISGVAHLKFKESDRLSVLAEELGKLGVEAQETPDGLLIKGGKPRGGEIDPHGDHRIAMSFAILGLKVGGVKILDPACVSKSYPGFWEDLKRISRP